MNINQISGFLFIGLGALLSGSFSIPFDKVKSWKWENYWLVYSMFAYVVFPLLACIILVPDFMTVYKQVPTSSLCLIFFLGIIYGIANLTFGLSLRYLGVSLGYALSLGLMMAIGTLIPPLVDGRIYELFKNANGNLLLYGVLTSAIGIALSGYAGFLKDGKNQTVNNNFHFIKGTLAALFVGITGSTQALGIEQGLPIANKTAQLGTNPLYRDSPVFLILYLGSFLATAVWCLFSGWKNGSLKSLVSTRESGVVINYIFCGLAGLLWYINYFFFGIGKNMMGPYTFTAWGISMTLTILCAALWGIYRGEWKNVKKSALRLLIAGLVTLVVSSFMIGMSNN